MFFLTKLKKILKKKKHITFIQFNEDLNFLRKAFDKEDLFCIDTEFDWRTTYLPKLSLVQVGFRNEIFIIDCLKVNPENILKLPLENSNHLKIFHSVRSDTTVLKNCLEIDSRNVFDIQVAEKNMNHGVVKSYAKLVSKYIGKYLDKSETNSNWLKRPLDQNQVKYAANDVDYLLDIFYLQKSILKKKGLLNKVLAESENEAKLGNQDIKVARLKKQKRKLNSRQKQIFLWREETARLENIPPSFLFKDKHLILLSNLNKDEKNLESKVLKILGDTKWSKNFVSNFF